MCFRLVSDRMHSALFQIFLKLAAFCPRVSQPCDVASPAQQELNADCLYTGQGGPRQAPSCVIFSRHWVELSHTADTGNSFLQALNMKTTKLNQKQISDLAFHLIFHLLSPFNCWLSVVL